MFCVNLLIYEPITCDCNKRTESSILYKIACNIFRKRLKITFTLKKKTKNEGYLIITKSFIDNWFQRSIDDSYFVTSTTSIKKSILHVKCRP